MPLRVRALLTAALAGRPLADLPGNGKFAFRASNSNALFVINGSLSRIAVWKSRFARNRVRHAHNGVLPRNGA